MTARAAHRLLAALLAVACGLLGAVLLYYTSLQPGAALTRAVFNRNAIVTPPAGFGQVARTVTERRVPIVTSGAPTAHLDVYTPGTAGGTARYPPTFLSVGDADPFRGQAAELASVIVGR